MERFVHYGDRIVARYIVNDAKVSDCPRRRKSLSLDDLEKFLSRPPRTLAEWAERTNEFWKERT